MSKRPLWHDAAALAARAHRHQVRRDGETPYAAHPGRVALTLAVVFGCTDEEVLAAAYLHDVIEDADIDFDDIHAGFGRRVADLCATLTKDMRLIEEERERRYDEQLAAGPWEGRLIKLGDVFDNLCDARNADQRRTLIGRARRALALADGEAELEQACAVVRALMESVERELAGP
jgi:(p)ppGpp synthase/HD superfamily hydrolase